MEFLKMNWMEIVGILVASVAVFRGISKLTKNKVDDKIVEIFERVVGFFGAKRP